MTGTGHTSPWFWALFFAVSTVNAGPATRPGSALDEKQRQQAQSSLETAKLQAIAVQSPADVAHISMSSDMLAMQLLLHNVPRQSRIVLPNKDIIATLQVFPSSSAETASPQGFFLVLRDFSQPGSMSVWTTISSANGRVQLSRDYESATVSGSVDLVQDAPPFPGRITQAEQPVRLNIRRTNELTGRNDVQMRLAAPTFVALRRAHPTETEEFLRPILHDLGEEAAVFAPDPAAAWQVLADAQKPDAGLLQQVNDAIGKFDSQDFQTRQSAAHTLHVIGEPAALALMQADRSKYSAAMNSGIDTFLAPYLPLSDQEAKRLGRDRDFLLDCQYCDDESLRLAAAARLADVTGQPNPFDPTADGDTRLAQVRRFRQTFAATTQTSTPTH